MLIFLIYNISNIAMVLLKKIENRELNTNSTEVTFWLLLDQENYSYTINLSTNTMIKFIVAIKSDQINFQ